MKCCTVGFMLGTFIVCAQPRPSFEVASIKPSNSGNGLRRFGFRPGSLWIAENVTVKSLIENAYTIRPFQISGGPAWTGSDLFDITARPPDGTKRDQVHLMIQSLLAERFQLVIRRETKEMPVYALVVSKKGLKIKEADESAPNMFDLGAGNPADPGAPRHAGTMIRRGQLMLQEGHIADLAHLLSPILEREVVDKTRLTGRYDIKLEWTPDESQTAMFQGMGVPDTLQPDPADPSVFTALEEQLGLRLESQKGLVEMFMIERVERPSEN